MDDERAPIKAKNFAVDGSKRGRLKRWKEAIEKDMLARDVKRSDAQDCTVWRLNCKNWTTRTCGKNKLGSRKTKLIVNTPATNGW